jgi:hypothetical protein
MLLHLLALGAGVDVHSKHELVEPALSTLVLSQARSEVGIPQLLWQTVPQRIARTRIFCQKRDAF